MILLHIDVVLNIIYISTSFQSGRISAIFEVERWQLSILVPTGSSWNLRLDTGRNSWHIFLAKFQHGAISSYPCFWKGGITLTLPNISVNFEDFEATFVPRVFGLASFILGWRSRHQVSVLRWWCGHPRASDFSRGLNVVVYVVCWWEVTNSVTKVVVKDLYMFFLRVFKHNSPLAIQRGAIFFHNKKIVLFHPAGNLWPQVCDSPKPETSTVATSKQRKLPAELPSGTVVMESALSLEGANEERPHGPPNGQLDGVWLNADCPWEEYTVSWMKSIMFIGKNIYRVCKLHF